MSQPNECKSKTNRDLVTCISRDCSSQRKFTGSRWIPKDIQYFLYPIGLGFSFTTIKGNPSCKPRRRVPLVKLEAVLLKNLIHPGNRSSTFFFSLTYQVLLLWPFPNGAETALPQCRHQTRFPSQEPSTNHFQYPAVKHQVDTVNERMHQWKDILCFLSENKFKMRIIYLDNCREFVLMIGRF